jgi:hypothetical protein
VTRLCVLESQFRKALARLGIEPGTERGRAVGRTIKTLVEARTLPAVTDARVSIPPTRTAHARRVQGRNLWLWYRVGDDESVHIIFVSSEPPTPID